MPEINCKAHQDIQHCWFVLIVIIGLEFGSCSKICDSLLKCYLSPFSFVVILALKLKSKIILQIPEPIKTLSLNLALNKWENILQKKFNRWRGGTRIFFGANKILFKQFFWWKLCKSLLFTNDHVNNFHISIYHSIVSR